MLDTRKGRSVETGSLSASATPDEDPVLPALDTGKWEQHVVGRERWRRVNSVSDDFEAQGSREPSEIVVSDQYLDAPMAASPSRGRAQAPLGIGSGPTSPASNDDAPGAVAVKRSYQRRKPREADLRCSTMVSSIHPADYDQGRIAFNRSWEIGLGLDTAVTLRPAAFQDMTPEDRNREVRLFLKRIRSFYADNDDMPPLAYLLTREAEYGDVDGGSEHVHLLIHTNTTKARRKLKRYLHRRYSTIEAKVKTASPERVRLPNGQIGDASTYSLKSVAAPYAEANDFPHRFSGPVYGAKVFWSENINPVRPRIRVPRLRTKIRTSSPRPAEQSPA